MEPKASPSALWERHLLGTQAWIRSKFSDQSGALAAIEALKDWLGRYPNQVEDVSKLALSSAFTAVAAAAHELAGAFAAVAVDGSTFKPLKTQDECAAAALAVLILAESQLETGKTSKGGSLLQYARIILARMDVTSALRVWGQAQCELIAGAFAEALLERKRAAEHYERARDTGEPLIRNPRLRKQLANEWIGTVYGKVKEIAAQDQLDTLVQNLVRTQYVIAALAAARVAPVDRAADAAHIAAAACAEFGVPRRTPAVNVHAALDRLPNETRLATLDKLLTHIGQKSDRTSKAATAALLGLRANTPANTAARDDLHRARNAATEARDGYAWATLTADTIRYNALEAGTNQQSAIDMFLLAYADMEKHIRRTPRHMPFRAYFEPALHLATANAFNDFAGARTLSRSAHLSNCLEAGRMLAVQFDIRRAAASPALLQQAHVAATDWLGRIAHAVKSRPDVLVIVFASLPHGTALICIANDTANGIEMHVASNDYTVAAGALANAMREQFQARRSDLSVPGRAAFGVLPQRIQELLNHKKTVLLVPDFAAEQSAIPYELFHGPAGFLGITHVVARFMTLRDAAFALEPGLLRASPPARALCVSAPNTVPNEPLRFADEEIHRVRECLTKANWSLPEVEELQLTPGLLLDGLERGALVHVAAHGEVFEGSHAILLPHGERLVADAVASRQGELSAAVYLSACSIGASEYLGGGVSRGFAAALVAKGVPVVVASQWPLQDAAAERFAQTFYETAVNTGVGDAIRTARKGLAGTVEPALWASLILIGNPWYRLGTAEVNQSDTSVELLRVASDPSPDEKKRRAALGDAATALKAEPDDRRLAAAITWATEIRALFGEQNGALSIEWAEQMADLAHDLGTLGGEVLCRSAAADLLRAEGRNGAARASLDRAIDISGRIVRQGGGWDGVLRNLLAERQRMDLDFEVPEFKSASGITVNDRSDPAVRAVFEIQDALDQQNARRVGVVQPRLPDQSLQDLCWNAVVLGQRNRFPDEFACAAFAEQLAARATASGWIEPTMEADARCVAAGLLRFLWSTQRMTHLLRETAIGQSGTLSVALGALARDRDPAGSEGAQRRAHIEELGRQLVTTPAPLPGDRFARARDRLRNVTAAPNAAGLGTAAGEYIVQARPKTASRAHRAAWVAGLLLELAYDARRNSQAELADRILIECGNLESAAEGHLIAYLMEGFKEVGTMLLDPLIQWK